MTLSICIVSHQAREYLEQCLELIEANPFEGDCEIIVVDNGSTDGTAEMVNSRFPKVRLIREETNKGFAAPMNRALQLAAGDYLLLLNPDTLVHAGAMGNLVGFMQTHSEVGICGPKVLNTDGTLQLPCRRGEPTPWAVIAYFLRLYKLFPGSKFFGGYLMNYLGEDELHIVAGVSGSCMLVRREVFARIGYLDEQFFAYQEDADICRRARQAGWQVYYVPSAQITHYGGQGGSRAQPYRSIFAWHYSYYLYYRKHLRSNYFFLINWLYYLAMLLKLLLALLVNVLRREKFAGRQHPK